MEGQLLRQPDAVGAAAGERCEAAVDYNWGLGGPTGVGVGTDNFSARWVKTQSFTAGTHTFTATADDGVRSTWTAP